MADWWDADTQPTRMGHADERDLQRVIRRSFRVGRSGGRPARTFSCNFGSVTAAAGVGRARSGLAYIERAEDHAGKADELEAIGGNAGSREELAEALEAVDAGVRIRRGRTAERVALKLVMELPADADQAGRRAAAKAVEEWFSAQGLLCRWAIHLGDKLDQPHLHVISSARPVTRTAAGWVVDRSTKRRPLAGKAAVRLARRELAAAINQAAKPAVAFFGGRDAELDVPGITGRKPRRRLPQRVWHVDRPAAQQGENQAQHLVDYLRTRHKAERADRRQRAQELKAEVAQRRAARIAKAPAGSLRGEIRQARAGAGQMLWRANEEERARRKAEAELAAERTSRETADADLQAERQAQAAPALNERQRTLLADFHRKAGLQLPDLTTRAGQAEAWAEYRLAALRLAHQQRDQARQAAEALAAAAPPAPADPRTLLPAHFLDAAGEIVPVRVKRGEEGPATADLAEVPAAALQALAVTTRWHLKDHQARLPAAMAGRTRRQIEKLDELTVGLWVVERTAAGRGIPILHQAPQTARQRPTHGQGRGD